MLDASGLEAMYAFGRTTGTAGAEYAACWSHDPDLAAYVVPVTLLRVLGPSLEDVRAGGSVRGR